MSATTHWLVATFLFSWWTRCILPITMVLCSTTSATTLGTIQTSKQASIKTDVQHRQTLFLDESILSVLRESNSSPRDQDQYYYSWEVSGRNNLKSRSSLPKFERKYRQRLRTDNRSNGGTSFSNLWLNDKNSSGKGSGKGGGKGQKGGSTSKSNKASKQSKTSGNLSSSKKSKNKYSKAAKQPSKQVPVSTPPIAQPTLQPMTTTPVVQETMSPTFSTAPTMSLMPLGTPSPSPASETMPPVSIPSTGVPTGSPVFGPIPTVSPLGAPTTTVAPAVTPTTSPMLAETTAPALAPTTSPMLVTPTSAPTPRNPDAPTRAPSDGIIVDVSYDIPSGMANDEDLSAAGDVTVQYLQDFFEMQFEFSTMTDIESFEGIVVGTSPADTMATLSINVMFSSDSQFIPSMEDVSSLLFAAFQQPFVNGLITSLGTELPASNPLSATTQVEAIVM